MPNSLFSVWQCYGYKKNDMLYQIMQKVDVMKLLHIANLLITLQLTTYDVNLIALEMYLY